MTVNSTTQKMKTAVLITAILQAFNGLSALAGGFGLITNPDGEALAMSSDWLQSTPFTNFLIPGIVLFAFNGLGNIAGFIAILRKNEKAPWVAAAFGVFMMMWIVAQVTWIGYKSFLQPLYFSTGMLQLISGLIWIKNQTNE